MRSSDILICYLHWKYFPLSTVCLFKLVYGLFGHTEALDLYLVKSLDFSSGRLKFTSGWEDFLERFEMRKGHL